MNYYLCDGQKYDCSETRRCHMNGGKCRYTNDILHAENHPADMEFKHIGVSDRVEITGIRDTKFLDRW